MTEEQLRRLQTKMAEKQASISDSLLNAARGTVSAVGDAGSSLAGGVASAFSGGNALPSARDRIRAVVQSQKNTDYWNTILRNSAITAGGAGLLAYLSTAGQRPPQSIAKFNRSRVVPLPSKKSPEKDKDKDKEQLAKEADDSATGSWLFNPSASSPDGVPALVAAKYLAPLAAGYASWHLTRNKMNKDVRLRANKRVEDAQRQYQEALNALSARDEKEKSGSADDCLDRAFDVLSKAASIEKCSMPDWVGNALGHYLLYAGLTAPLGYHLVDEYMQGSNKNVLLDKAIRERERRHSAAQPAKLRAVVEDEQIASPTTPKPKVKNTEANKDDNESK